MKENIFIKCFYDQILTILGKKKLEFHSHPRQYSSEPITVAACHMLYEMGSQLISLLLLHFLFLFSLSQCRMLAGGILAPADRQVDDTQSYAAWSGPV
jgi:hypothetical protein